MSNIGSEFDSRIGGDIAAAETFLDHYDYGDVISYEDLDEADFSDPGWHAIRGRLIEVPGEGYRVVPEDF